LPTHRRRLRLAIAFSTPTEPLLTRGENEIEREDHVETWRKVNIIERGKDNVRHRCRAGVA
jgi:hypothetical protein